MKEGMSICYDTNTDKKIGIATCELLHFKANMNSYILLQTAAIFFLSILYLKQGIDSVYVMVGFICKRC